MITFHIQNNTIQTFDNHIFKFKKQDDIELFTIIKDALTNDELGDIILYPHELINVLQFVDYIFNMINKYLKQIDKSLKRLEEFLEKEKESHKEIEKFGVFTTDMARSTFLSKIDIFIYIIFEKDKLVIPKDLKDILVYNLGINLETEKSFLENCNDNWIIEKKNKFHICMLSSQMKQKMIKYPFTKTSHKIQVYMGNYITLNSPWGLVFLITLMNNLTSAKYSEEKVLTKYREARQKSIMERKKSERKSILTKLLEE